MIDYVIANDYCMDIVINFKVVGWSDSDHMPLVLEVSESGGREKSSEEAKKREEEAWRYRWKEDIELYKERTAEGDK